jgi:hypothetical protein
MASAAVEATPSHLSNGDSMDFTNGNDPFVERHTPQRTSRPHRYSAFFDPDALSVEAAASTVQLKRTIQAHLSETDRRLEETQRLGTSLLHQQQELSEKLKELENNPDDAEITPELRTRLAEIESEYNDLSRQIAKALLVPKARTVSAEDSHGPENTGLFASQATSSPSKVSVPSRRQRNQPSSRVGDIQFAADISTSLLAQVRQLQVALNDRDEALKSVNLEKVKLEYDVEGFTHRLRALDESEQRYKDENWNLETQTHELLAASKDAADREKKLNVALAAALAEKAKAQTDLEDVTLAHAKLTDEHAVVKKAHDSELHTLRRTIDSSETDRSTMQAKIDELTSQNQELAKAVASRYRSQGADDDIAIEAVSEDLSRDPNTPEHSPPPSPTKATPRHGGLESETLKSSLHHAHRMIQNLKGNIHREKTEKIELKRMLQDARDELEQQRGNGAGSGSGTKRQKTRSDIFKKPLRPEILGANRKARTDVEFDDQDWEDQVGEHSPGGGTASRSQPGLEAGSGSRSLDVSDAYQTANENEGAFETAHERDTTESEDFMTGAESLAGDSTDELTETEGRAERVSTMRGPRPPLKFKNPGDRSSYISTASTSAGEEMDSLMTPVQTQHPKYRLKVGRGSLSQQPRALAEGTPDSYHEQTTLNDSPAPTESRSPPAGGQSLFAELGGFDEAASDAQFSTPGHTSIASLRSTPGMAPRSSDRGVTGSQAPALPKLFQSVMVDSGTMTESEASLGPLRPGDNFGAPSPSDFPLPPSLPSSPLRHDTSTQYTPLRSHHESPHRTLPTFITPPKTIWDEANDHESSGPVPTPNLQPVSQQIPVLALSEIVMQESKPTWTKSMMVDEPKSVQKPKEFFMCLAPLQSQETIPAEIGPGSEAVLNDSAATDASPTSSKNKIAGSVLPRAGMLATVGAALSLSKAKDTLQFDIAKDSETTANNQAAGLGESSGSVLKEMSGNRDRPGAVSQDGDASKPDIFSSNDRGSQTLLSSAEISRALQGSQPAVITEESRAKVFVAPIAPIPILAAPSSRSGSRSRDKAFVAEVTGVRDLGLSQSISPFRRPSSANSQRVSSAGLSHPPLPSDHKTAIVRAGGRLSSPAGEPSNSSRVSTIMGPPIAPASAYRRPRTPADQAIPVNAPNRGGTTPRTSLGGPNRSASQLSRRSSNSSFASELDERFNIRTDPPGMPTSQPFEAGPGTDPRMIQAITQTMIGEFLWKYTRKAGGINMSSTRHRRYFWVHPYTRTLYWSDQDPQSAGRSQLKAKSVAIESVRVVSDDNPMPPGLHRKSLEVITPGRKIKFTAPTGQRHETWFNALSYLLLRGQDPSEVGAYSTGGNALTDGGLTQEDVGEFNPGFSRALHPTNSSRLSMSSYNSRTTHGTIGHSEPRLMTRQPLPSTATAATRNASTASWSTAHQNPPPQRSQTQDPDATLRKGSVSSRFSKMLGSMSTRNRTERASEPGPGMASTSADAGNNGSIYDASVISDGGRDSAEELRQEMLKQEREANRLENVRACCDGKLVGRQFNILASLHILC